MRIVLDLQACQSVSRRRGIGRYSLALAKTIAANPRGHEVTLLLNAAMGESIEYLRGEFSDLLPQSRIVIWHPVTPTASVYPANAFRRQISEMLRIRALRELKPDIVHVASLFEGFVDPVVLNVRAGESFLSVATLYDLIPLAHKRTYLTHPLIRRWYMEKVESLRRCELLLGISQFACMEARDLLAIPAERVVEISGAADDIFCKLENAEALRAGVAQRFGIAKPFVMYAGGFDPRKNIAALIRAFALLPPALRTEYQLVIVGDVPRLEWQALMAQMASVDVSTHEVVFAGYVSDLDLVKLYNLCALYAFPSLQEGFGLPVLEAMSCGAVVIGSNTSSLPEIIGREDALFDPRKDQSIADKMVMGLTDQAFRSALREHALHQPRKFSWAECGRRALDAIEAVHASAARTHSPLSPHQTPKAATAVLPAPNSTLSQSVLEKARVFADVDCMDSAGCKPLECFIQERHKFQRVLIEVSDHAYCAKTLALADISEADLVIRNTRLGVALQALGQNGAGRELLVALLYRWGGYAAIATANNVDFSAAALAELLPPASLTALGSCQILEEGTELSADTSSAASWRQELQELVDEICRTKGANRVSPEEWIRIAQAISRVTRRPVAKAQLLVDISNLFVRDAGTGIQRVVRHVLDEMILRPPEDFRVEPVFLDDQGVLRYARSYCARRYVEHIELPPNEPVELRSSDIYLGLDLAAHVIPTYIEFFRSMRADGIRQYFVVYDLLPILRPDCFDPNGLPYLRAWYESIAEVADGIVGISRSVADEFERWLHQGQPKRHRSLNIGYFHLGADMGPVNQNCVTTTQSDDLPRMEAGATFLMVGTVEPRKGHVQALSAFETMWELGQEVNLLIVGKQGWLTQELAARLRAHPMQGRRLVWLDDADDDLLFASYHRADALLMASEGEGFGLPLIEAARYGLPLIARDLPVFREIAGDHAYYFSGFDGKDLADALHGWLYLHTHSQVPQSKGLSWLTWRESTDQLIDTVLKDRWIHSWRPGARRRRFAAYDYRLHSDVGELKRGSLETSGKSGWLVYGPYIELPAGRYQLRLLGVCAKLSSGWIDIVSGPAPVTVHARSNLSLRAKGEGDTLALLDFALHKNATEFQVRVFVDAETVLQIRELELELASGHPITESCQTTLTSAALS